MKYKFPPFVTKCILCRDGNSSSELDKHSRSVEELGGITNTCYKGNYYNAGLQIHFYMYYCWNGSCILRDSNNYVKKGSGTK
jgi:hypothetical protein